MKALLELIRQLLTSDAQGMLANHKQQMEALKAKHVGQVQDYTAKVNKRKAAKLELIEALSETLADDLDELRILKQAEEQQ